MPSLFSELYDLAGCGHDDLSSALWRYLGQRTTCARGLLLPMTLEGFLPFFDFFAAFR